MSRQAKAAPPKTPKRRTRNASPPEREKLKWVQPFLARLADTCNVRASCEKAGVSRAVAYVHKGRSSEFSKAWDEAVDDGVDVLEFVARQRSIRVDAPSDLLLIFLLKAHRPEKYSDKIKVDVTIDDLRREAEEVARDTGLDFEEIWEETQRIYAKERRQR